jgi:hypothetical protein
MMYYVHTILRIRVREMMLVVGLPANHRATALDSKLLSQSPWLPNGICTCVSSEVDANPYLRPRY